MKSQHNEVKSYCEVEMTLSFRKTKYPQNLKKLREKLKEKEKRKKKNRYYGDRSVTTIQSDAVYFDIVT